MPQTAIDCKQVASQWAERGFTCDLWTDPPGERWEDFTHDTDEVVMVIDGELEFVVDGEVSHPRPGEELVIPAGAVHSARNIGTSTAHWLYGYRRC
jgi:quercetin dioxygenase-like cupin family protein